MRRLFSTFLVATCVAGAALVLSHGVARAGLPPPITIITPNPAPFGASTANASSFVAGGHAGYNWQQGLVVFGFETDLQGTHLQSRVNAPLSSTPPLAPTALTVAQATALIDWYGTLRGRVGFATGPWLFYGTGGFAYGNAGLNSTFTAIGLSTAFSTSSLRTGWVGGLGFEYLFRPNLSFGILYQYVDLGNLNGFSMTTGPVSSLSQSASTHAQFQSAMATFSWRFAPGSSGPWSGGYGGGQAGGAWGNNTTAGYRSTAAPTITTTCGGFPC